jgi:radical SAM protein with 4Fe4S-binding SPASM domain
VPIGVEEINKLKTLGVTAIQISLDSIFFDDLQTNLNVGEHYYKKILQTVENLDKSGIQVKIKSVITNQIFNIDRIGKSIDYYKQFKNVNIVELTAATSSNYKTNQQFLQYRLSLEQIQQLKNLVTQKSEQVHFSLKVDAQVYTKEMFYNSVEYKKDLFHKRSVCSGNERSFYILPNGDTTICEETYFNKNLKLGNILNHSIMEMWNSDHAKKLFFISQDKFPQGSYCSKCAEFYDCRHKAGICWVDVISAYGDENWLYPSPECPYSPSLINEIYSE